MIKFPIEHMKANIFFTKDNNAWAYYKIGENSIGINDREQEDKLIHSLNKLSWQLSSFEEIDYKIIPFPIDISKKIDDISGRYEGQYAEIGRYYANRAKDILADEVKDAVEYKFFIGVKLKEENLSDEGPMQEVFKAFKGINQTIKHLTGAGAGFDVQEAEKKFKSNEEEAFSEISAYLGAYRLTEEEMRYMVRYQFMRGNGRPEPKQGLYSLTEGILDPKEAGFLKIEQIEKESYCAFLPISELPIDLLYSSWAHSFQAFSFPVEMNIRAVYKGREPDYKETNKMKKRFREQDAQLIEANEDEDTLISQGRVLLYELENDIKNQNKPLIRTHAQFVVYGSTKEQCRARAKSIIKRYEDQSLEVVQPLADQLLLFHQAIPGAEIVANDWEQLLTPESFAESLFSLTRKIGNHTGFYLGRDISLPGERLENSKQLVFFDPFIARLGVKGSKYSSPHSTLSGPTGMGKSYLLKLIILNALFMGAKVLITDPKNEIEKAFKKLAKGDDPFSQIVNSFNFITFSADKQDAGKLDPLTFLEKEEAQDTALSILEYLAEIKGDEREIKTAISEAVRTVVKEESKPGLLKVVKRLQADPLEAVKHVGNYLYEIGTNGTAKLLFSDGNVKGINLSEQVNILQIQNLTLPGEGEKPSNRDEHIAVALMIPLAKFAAKFARDDSQTKLTIFEEAWMLTSTGQGHKLIKEMLRTGRSLKSSVYLVTQSISDYNKADIKENIGTKFAFKAKTAEEAGHIIEYLGLEDNKANRDMLKNLTEGECIMEDIYGRTAKIKADVLFSEWVQAFNTKDDKNNTAELEEAFI
ncbi:ATP-binding protein [Peribacillus sp. R9-11]|uniref:ATP-binding protein n=1 Tax=Peribacillus sp. R9-11 TaxID=3073271 RepID=UPI002868CBE3|nr:ATP-binding protein [Peribacillus sp. R9-11]WMX58979.1 ATP-binding protein [Peribacillus sp. R9-11]